MTALCISGLIKKTRKFPLWTVVLFFGILIMSSSIAHAGSCQNCTVTITNGLNFNTDITLEYNPAGSAQFQARLGAVSPGQTITIQVPSDKCPLRLSGGVWSGYRSYAVQDKCPGDNSEGSPFKACSVEECKSSTWIIQGGGGSFRFIRQ